MKSGKSRKEKEKTEREKHKPTVNWQGSDSGLSASCRELLAPRAGNFTTQPRNYTGVRAGGKRGAAAPPPKSQATQIFWPGREIWAKPVFKEVSMFFFYHFEERYFLF